MCVVNCTPFSVPLADPLLNLDMELAERDTALRWVAACENIAKGAMWLVCNVCGSYLSD
jgi:hypothetical protein